MVTAEQCVAMGHSLVCVCHSHSITLLIHLGPLRAALQEVDSGVGSQETAVVMGCGSSMVGQASESEWFACTHARAEQSGPGCG